MKVAGALAHGRARAAAAGEREGDRRRARGRVRVRRASVPYAVAPDDEGPPCAADRHVFSPRPPGGVAACGEEGISVPSDERARRGDSSTSAARAATRSAWRVPQGSTTNVRTREYKDGPNFDQRKVTANCALYAIRNGGFSSGPMPQNIVVGEEAEALAEFLAKYSGKDVETEPGARPDRRRLPRGRSAMLDLRAISRDPEPARAALARRRDGSDERLATPRWPLRVAAERAAARARGGAGRAQRRREGDRRGQAHRRRRVGGDRRDAGGERAGQGARARGRRGSRRSSTSSQATLPNPPDPSAADEDNVLQRVGLVRARPAATTSSWPAR